MSKNNCYCPNFNVNKIRVLKRYSIEILSNQPYFFSRGIIDEESKIAVSTVSGISDKYEVYYYRNNGNSFGKSSSNNKWYMLLDDGDFPVYYTEIINMLKVGHIVATKYINGVIRVTLNYNVESIINVCKNRVSCSKMKNINKNAIITVDVNKEDYTIIRCLITFNCNDNKFFQEIKIAPYSKEIAPPLEVLLNTSFDKIERKVLFLNLKTIGGWTQPVHCICTQRAINFIRNTDRDKKYTEIYSNKLYTSVYRENDSNVPDEKYHPLVIGSYYEDEVRPASFYYNWFGFETKTDNYYRDYNHFGAKDIGLDYSILFELREIGSDDNGETPDAFIGNRFFSAKNWGYGNWPAANYNFFNIKEAIKQYCRYSFNGRRNAYLILGHIVHLLQDQAQPDHAALVPHPGSGMDEPTAYSEFYVCALLGAEVGIGGWLFGGFLFGLVAGGVAYLVCNGSISSAEVGYEKFVDDYWKFDYSHWNNRPDISIPEYKIVKLDYYDNYFETMGDFSINAKNRYGLQCPLGLGKHPAVGFDGYDPDIDVNDNSKKETFLKLSDELISENISYSASFIEYFYDIVNPPPIVQRVTVVMNNTSAVPIGFGKLNNSNSSCEKDIVVYDSYWDNVNEYKREQKTPINIPLTSNKQGYIFVAFGPENLNGKYKTMDPNSVQIKLYYHYLVGPDYTDILVPATLIKAIDSDKGEYYWGKIELPEDLGGTADLLIMVSAKDNEPHLHVRDIIGDELQSNVEIVPKIIVEDPSFPFIGYKAGWDTKHQLNLVRPTYIDKYEINDSFDNATKAIFNQEVTEGITFSPLCLPVSSDKDFFFISLKDLPLRFWDINATVNRIGAGLTLVTTPVRVYIKIVEEYGYCYDITIYSKDMKEYKVFSNCNEVILQPNLIPDGREFYIEIKNSDYEKQGALNYSLVVDYSNASFSIEGGLLSRIPLFKNKILPYPTPDIKVLYDDPVILVNDLKASIGNILTAENVLNLTERRIRQAEYLNVLGNIAKEIKLYDISESLYIKGYELYSDTNNLANQINSLDSLRSVYTATNALEKIKILDKVKSILIR